VSGEGRGLAEVIAAHGVTPEVSSGPDCVCGWFQLWPRHFQHSEEFITQHAAHVAEQVAAHLAGKREAVARALYLADYTDGVSGLTTRDSIVAADAALAALGD
jgi:thioredoxin reductase